MVNDHIMALIVLFNMCAITIIHYLSTNNMCDAHEVIVDNVRKVISRITVTLHQYRVIYLLVRKFDLAMNFILNNGFSFRNLFFGVAKERENMRQGFLIYTLPGSQSALESDVPSCG
jgi:hypothetical protein